MSTRQNRFGFESIDEIEVASIPRRRAAGPMSAAVRETAETVQTEAGTRVETRRRNAAEAREYRAAQADGLVMRRVALDEIRTDDLPRDRLDLDAVAGSDEMDELKASIRAHGQKEPIELYADKAGRLQLKKGWRRLTALSQLHRETGRDAFATALARIEGPGRDRLGRYVDMVEENILREDLSFAEMAQLAIRASADPALGGASPDVMVLRLYGSLHKMKRSYIRAFVGLMEAVGDVLPLPRAVPRNLGVEVARRLREEPGLVPGLRAALGGAADIAAQTAALEAVLAPARPGAVPAAPPAGGQGAGGQGPATRRFRHGTAHVTVRPGEVRIRDETDFTALPEARLTAALAAFYRALDEEG